MQQPTNRELSVEERWLFAIQQLQNVCKLLDGDMTDSVLTNSKGECSRKFSIEFKDIFKVAEEEESAE